MKNLVVLCTTPSMELAKILATTLVKEKLAACVNIIPKMISIYQWDDEICEDQELLLIIKTTEKKYPRLQSRILATHHYEVPEIIALPIGKGSPAYMEWIEQALAD